LPQISIVLNLAVAVRTEMQRIFKWSQRHRWERVCRDLLADVLNDAVIAEIRHNHPTSLSDDDFEWLNATVAKVNKHSPRDVPAILKARLPDFYDYVHAFHATRSESAQDFVNHGIKLSDTAVLRARAVERLGESEALIRAILELRQSGYEDHNHGKIYLSLTKDGCLKDNRHCMDCGGEYLSRLVDHPEQTARLRSGGKPLVVECRIPASALDSEFWRGRSFAMLDDYLTRLVRPSERPKVKGSNVVIKQPISDDNILSVLEFIEVNRTIRWNDFLTGAPQQSELIELRLFKIWPGRAQF
jgi:hypothetical protein